MPHHKLQTHELNWQLQASLPTDDRNKAPLDAIPKPVFPTTFPTVQLQPSFDTLPDIFVVIGAASVRWPDSLQRQVGAFGV